MREGVGEEGRLLIHSIDDTLIGAPPRVPAKGKASDCHHIENYTWLWGEAEGGEERERERRGEGGRRKERIQNVDKKKEKEKKKKRKEKKKIKKSRKEKHNKTQTQENPRIPTERPHIALRAHIRLPLTHLRRESVCCAAVARL